MIIDSHAHLDSFDEITLSSILIDAQQSNVEKIVCIGTSLEDSQIAINLAQKHNGLYATVGIHPNDNRNLTVATIDWDLFKDLAKKTKVVAIGECGLDYSKFSELNDQEIESEMNRQKLLFLKQIQIAVELALPLSIHVRDAYADMLDLASLVQTNAVFHCFSGTQQYLEKLLALSSIELDTSKHTFLNRATCPTFFFSFAGNITFRNATHLRDLAKLIPLERILIETDCPFLSPEPFRGKQNCPSNVKIIAEKLAEIKNISFSQLVQQTTINAKQLFRF